MECVLIGDFNEVEGESKRMGSIFHHNTDRIFNHFMEHAELIDIPLGNPRFTWSNKWGSKFSKLDRILILNGFLDCFPHSSGLVLEKYSWS